MILLIDNYDSFSYNLYQLIGEINPDIKVIRNDEMSIEEIEAYNPSHIILSPGPGKPADAGVCIEVVQKLKGKYPIFGVCLGHQAICEAFGATVSYAKQLMHGKTSIAKLENAEIFQGMKERVTVARYHSLSAVRETIPDELEIIAYVDDEEEEIMAVQHKEYEIYGVQFHPESILTPEGKTILVNFLGGEEK